MTDLDCYPRARNADPHTSHEAARLAEKIAPQQRWQVLQALRRFGRRTSAELAACAYLDRYTVARRLPELARAGQVRRCPATTCPVSGRQAVTWEAVDPDDGQRRLF